MIKDKVIEKHLNEYSTTDRAIFSSYLAEEMENGLKKLGIEIKDEDELRVIMATRVTKYNDKSKGNVWFIIDQGNPTQGWICGVNYVSMKILRPISKIKTD